MKEIIKSSLLKGIAKIAFSAAQNSANSTCSSYHFQDKLPETVKSLRKF